MARKISALLVLITILLVGIPTAAHAQSILPPPNPLPKGIALGSCDPSVVFFVVPIETCHAYVQSGSVRDISAFLDRWPNLTHDAIAVGFAGLCTIGAAFLGAGPAAAAFGAICGFYFAIQEAYIIDRFNQIAAHVGHCADIRWVWILGAIPSLGQLHIVELSPGQWGCPRSNQLLYPPPPPPPPPVGCPSGTLCNF